MSRKDFETFYNENIDKIYRFVFFRVGAKETAEDLVSEIFMKALNNFEKFDEEISRTAWIFTIARNLLANFWRDNAGKKNLSAEALAEEEGEIAPEAWLAKAEAEHNNSLIKAEIYDYLDKLGEDEREIVTFHYLYGYSYSEIAKMREMTETAVKVAAHRAIKKMRIGVK